MSAVKNILFIMCDQLRADYLSCYGHPRLHTPHIDALAARGVTFSRAYCQAPICGPSRMSFYTGRYMFSHGASWNNYPLRVDERTMGDYLRPLGKRVVLVGKTHMAADREGMAKVGLDPVSELGVLTAECGFEPFERDDGLHPDMSVKPDLAYNEYLRAKGHEGPNPWHSAANSIESEDGETLSGWFWGHSDGAARVAEEDSETAYMTDRAMRFVTEAADQPWVMHLSYIKPHWPYIAPEPYASMYGVDDIVPVVRHDGEKQDPHPVYAAFMRQRDSALFNRPEARETIIPAYMGLVKQIDDHVGRLMAFLEERGQLDDTMIVFTSDHGDNLGDHWLGEKDLFHESSIRLPMIVVDPRSEADGTRGAVDARFVEAIDLVPTFVEAAGGAVQSHRMEGRSLLPLLRGEDVDWRDHAICESDYSSRPAREDLGIDPWEARSFMIRTERWKYILHQKFRPQLFDMENDPSEFRDLGDDPEYAAVRAELHEALFEWMRDRRLRVTTSEERIRGNPTDTSVRGIYIGHWKPEDC
jgi:arylsulfatase A-like enzyme